MDETKQRSRMEILLQRVAKQRDKLLRKVPALSLARQAILTDCLAREFPVETALRGAARKRDQLLHLYRLAIPKSVESILHRRFDAFQAAGLVGASRKLDGLKPSSLSMQQLRGERVQIPDLVNCTSGWLKLFRSPLAISLTACAVIAAAVLCFGRWRPSSLRYAERPNTPRLDEVNIDSGTELFTRKILIRPFDLNTNEPASLQASFVTNNSVHFADGIETPFGLRLDLPVRAFLTEDGLSRVP
jgi:hypothetical protein